MKINVKKIKLIIVAGLLGLSSVTLVNAADNSLVDLNKSVQEEVVYDINALDNENDDSDTTVDKIPEDLEDLDNIAGKKNPKISDDDLITSVKVSQNIHAILSNNGDILPVGSVAQFQLYLLFEGQLGVYKEVHIKIQLPENIDGKGILFNQDLSELNIRGVAPIYDEVNKTLEYTFDEIDGGFETSIPIKISTSNGANLNDEVLNVSFEVEAEGVDVVQADSTTTLSAAANISLTNKLIGISEGGETIVKNSVRHNDKAVFGVGISANKFDNGTMALKDSEAVILKYTLADGFTYISNTSGVEPTIDGQTLLWTFDPSDYSDQTYYYSNNFEITAELQEELQLFTKSKNVVSGEMTFVNDEVMNKTAETLFLISPDYSKDEAHSFPYGAYATQFSGPNDAYGNSSGSDNKDIEVTDGALLGWNIFMTPLDGTTPDVNANTYDIFFYPDPNSSVFRLYSGDFFYRPSSAYKDAGLLPLEKPVNYSISAKYKDSDDWARLVEFVEPGRMYTAEELNIDPERELDYLWLHFHNGERNTYTTYLGYTGKGGEWQSLQPGVNSGNIRFYTTIDDGYVGTIENKFGVSYSSWVATGYLNQGDSDNVPKEFTSHPHSRIPDGFQNFMTNKTVQVVAPAEGPTRYVKANAYFEKTDKNLLTEGDNVLNFVIGNDDASLKKLTGPFVTYALLDEGITVTNLDKTVGGVVEVLDTNYNDTHKTLIKITFNNNEITVNRYSAVQVPVSLTSDMAYKTEIKMIGYLDEDFEVATSSNTNGTITHKEIDVDDINGNNDVAEEVFTVTNTYTYKDSYEFVGMLYDEHEENFTKVGQNEILSTKLKVLNNLNTPIKNLSLIFVLPKHNDTYVLSNDSRDSEFSMNLYGEVVLPAKYTNRFDVFYSTTLEPEIKGSLDAHVGDLRTKVSDDLFEENTEWLTASEVSDFSTIQSIKIVMKADATLIRDSELVFEVNMKVDDIIDNAQFAFGSYAFAANDASVLETQKLIIEFEEKEIIDDEYSIEASDITLTVSEARTMQKEGTLNQYLLDNAQVKLLKNGVEVEDLSDVTVTLEGEIEDIIVGKYTMKFEWSDHSTETIILLAKTDAILNILEDAPTDPEEPEPEKPDPEIPTPEEPETETPGPEDPETEQPNPEDPKPEVPNIEKPDPKDPNTESPTPEKPIDQTPETGIDNPIVASSMLGILGVMLLFVIVKMKRKNIKQL